MSGGIFGVGVSALLAAQRQLQVTGHNIANVGTEGYSRQRAELAAREPLGPGFAAIGRGVDVIGIERVVDQFVNFRLGMRITAEAEQRTLAEFAGQVNNLLGDAESGLAPALKQFFAAVHDVANDPTSTAARQALITEAESLADRFAQLEARIQDQRAIASGRVRAGIAEINQLADSIAELNRAIVDARGRGGGAPPNDLLDKRDELVRRLAEYLPVDTAEQTDGSLNVYVGRGQALVVGFDATTLAARPVYGDPDRLAIGYEQNGRFVDVTSLLQGGELGALLDARTKLLDPASAELGRIAASLAETFNAVHRANMDLDGALGGDFFSFTMPAPVPGQGNAATGSPQVSIVDVGDLAASDYELRFDGTDFVVRRLSDGAAVGTIPPGGTAVIDGLSIDLSGVSGAAIGDSFLLQPTSAAATLSVAIRDPRAVAAALPVHAASADGNAGAGEIVSISVLDPSDPALRDPIDIEFVGGEFVVDGTAVPLDPSGETTIEANGWRVVIRGVPEEGDVFTVRDNAGAAGDNRGALALAALEDAPTMVGGTASYGDAYAGLVARVGVETRRAEINADVQARMLEEARAQRENVSGVNLDEEAANLLKAQQAYAAAAQVIATAGEMIDTLLQTMRR